jgi:CheY-like chemotaxis protein
MSRSDKQNDDKYHNNDDDSTILNSSPFSTLGESDINNLIVIGTIKVDEHSRLTFSKKIKSVFPIFPGDTIVVYQYMTKNDLLFRVQRYNEISDTWIVTKKKDSILPFSNTTKLKGISVNKNSHFINENNDKIKLQQKTNSVLNIMIVDDDEFIAETFKEILIELNDKDNEPEYNISTFKSSTDALKHFIDLNYKNNEATNCYDLIIIDVKMPDINGVQLYQMFKIMDSSIKVLFVSALEAISDLSNILPGINLDDIIKKPIEIEQFYLRVKEKIQS